VGDIKLARPIKIVVDCGNGIAGASAPAILRAIGCEVTELFSEVDGNFPNHHPDPSKPENLKDLIAALKAGDAELGLAFDGDGDRLGIVTKDGNNIYPDRQMMLFARDVLSRVPGGTILFDVKCSQRLAPTIGGRWCAPDVQDRPLADQGQDARDRLAAGRRNEWPHLLQGALVRF
jgi:phosphomannomutase